MTRVDKPARLKRTKYDYDVFVIGGGSAGVRAADTLAREGKRVGLADPHLAALGGFEATEGYGARAPLITTGRLYAEIKNANEVGIRGGSVGYNYPTLRDWNARAVSAGNVAEQLEALGVQLFEGTARFVGTHEVSLGARRLTSAQFIIASGSRVLIPSTIVGLASSKYLTPQSATNLLKPPKSVFIIGGGKTGVEFGSLFASFGSSVSIAEIAPRLLPEEDSEAGDLLRRDFETRGADVLTSTRVTSIQKESLLHRVTYLRGDVEHVVKAEAILLAGGRTPNLDVGLENAEVDYTPLGVTVGSNLQTSSKHIYAAGSITGMVHGGEGAQYQGELAANNLLNRQQTNAGIEALPAATYARIPIARVGVNEAEALRKDIPIRSSLVNLSETVAGRAARSDGFVKLVANRKGALIGVTAAGIGAADMVNGLGLAIAQGVSVETLAKTPFIYGSPAEALSLAARRLNLAA